MLRVGEDRAEKNPLVDQSRLTFEVADAHKLPYEDETFDYYTISFGIRNCTDIDKVLDEAYRVLKPGGRFMCLEFRLVFWLFRNILSNRIIKLTLNALVLV